MRPKKEISAKGAELSQKIAERLVELRKEKNLSQPDLVEALEEQYSGEGFSRGLGSIKDYEARMKYEFDKPPANFGSNLGMGADAIFYLAKFYGVTSDYILGLSDTKTTDSSLAGAASFTGLSEKAVENLRKAAFLHSSTLNKILEDDNILMLSLLLRTLETHNEVVQEGISAVRNKRSQTDVGTVYLELRDLKFNLYELYEDFNELVRNSLKIINIQDSERELTEIMMNSEEA